MALVLAVGGCSSTYRPAQSPRIATVMDGGSLALVRDGKSYPVGFFGGGVEDAVEGNSAAEEHARAFRNLTIAGFSTSVLGLGMEIGGLVLSANNFGNGGDSNKQAAGAVLVVSGIAAAIVGSVLIATAQPRLWDAVNTYNDGVDTMMWRMPGPPPPAPPGTQGDHGEEQPSLPARGPAPASAPAPGSAAPPASAQPRAPSNAPAVPSAAFPQ